MRPFAVAIAIGIATLYTIVGVRWCLQTCNWLPRQQRWRRASWGECQGCGYNLTGNISGRCPECGMKIVASEADAPAPRAPSPVTDKQPWWIWAAVLAAMIVAGLCTL